MSDAKPKKSSLTPPKRRGSRNSVTSTTSNNSLPKTPEKSDTPSPLTLQQTPESSPNSSPEKLSETPTKTDTPTKKSETPTKTLETPTKTLETPTKTPETPPSEQATPIKAIITDLDEPVQEIMDSTKDLKTYLFPIPITKDVEETVCTMVEVVSTTIEIKSAEENGNGIEKNGDYESDETESELEKLSVGTPDIDRNGSPILSRSATRRSDFRNIPTPKTPKVVTNGDEFDDSAPLPESPEVSIVFTDSEFADEPSEQASNTSTAATYGDLTLLSNETVESPRDLSYLKTLKVISGRKTLNDVRQQSRFGSGQLGKRKLEEYDFENSKRVKTESDDSGLFSYVASPISTIKSKFYRYEESTPIRKAPSPRVSNEKSWCTIQ